MSNFSERDLKLIEVLQYDPELTPAYEFIKSCLVWKDEWPDNLTPGIRKIMRSSHREVFHS